MLSREIVQVLEITGLFARAFVEQIDHVAIELARRAFHIFLTLPLARYVRFIARAKASEGRRVTRARAISIVAEHAIVRITASAAFFLNVHDRSPIRKGFSCT